MKKTGLIALLLLLVFYGFSGADSRMDKLELIKQKQYQDLKASKLEQSESSFDFNDVIIDVCTVVDKISAPGDTRGLAKDAGNLWANSDPFPLREQIFKINSASGVVYSSFFPPGDGPKGLELVGAYLWNVDTSDDHIYKLTKSGSIAGGIDIHPPSGSMIQLNTGIAWDGRNLWISYSEGIYKVDPNTGNILIACTDNDFKHGKAFGLTLDGNFLWGGSWISDEIIKISVPSTTFPLSVELNGNGSGIVTSTPDGISCGADCSELYDSGTVVSLTATADIDSIFTGWGGACSGTGTCTITMNQSRSVSANFTKIASTNKAMPWLSLLIGSENKYDLTVYHSGLGSGFVSSNPPGINCGFDCTESYYSSQMVTLTASANMDSTFVGWSGAGCFGTGTCQLTIDSPKTVTAIFNSNLIFDSETEPNDTKSTYDLIAFDYPITGQISSETDQDWFAVNNDSSRTATVDFSASTTGAYWVISVYNSSDTLLAQVDVGDNDSFNVSLPTTGLHYFVVTHRTGYLFHSDQYELLVQSNDGQTIP